MPGNLQKPRIEDYRSSKRPVEEIEAEITRLKPSGLLSTGVTTVFLLTTFFLFVTSLNAQYLLLIIPSLLISYLLEKFERRGGFSRGSARHVGWLQNELQAHRQYEEALAAWEWTRSTIHAGYWQKQRGIMLERSFGALMKKRNWKVEFTATTGDGGIDLICTRGGRCVYVQCKGHKKPLGVAAIRDAAGVAATNPQAEVTVVAPNGFTKGSIEFAQRAKVNLIDAGSCTQIAHGSADL